MEFDPKAYLASKAAPPATDDFDPKAYLASKTEQPPTPGTDNRTFEPDNPEPTIGGSLAKGAVEALVPAGIIGGGMLGATAGSAIPGAGTVLGGVVGSGTGGAVMTSIRDSIKSVFWPEDAPKTAMESVKNIAGGAALGVMAETGSIALSGGFKIAGAMFGKLAETAAGKMVSETAAAIGTGSKQAIGGAVAGAAAGGYVGGKKGAVVGGVLGAMGGAGQLQKMASVFKSDAAAATPGITAKAAKELKVMEATVGRGIGDLAKETDEILSSMKGSAAYPGPTVQTPYLTTGEASAQALKNATKEAQGRAGQTAETYYNALTRTIKRYFGKADHLKEMTTQDLLATARNRETDAGGLSARGLKNNAQAAKDIARQLRKQADEYVALTGDEALVNQYVELKQSFTTVKKATTAAKAVLKATEKQALIDAGQQEVARIISQGSKGIGSKYYNILKQAASRGLATAMTRHAHLLYTDPAYREAVSSLLSPDSGQASDMGGY